MAELKPIIYNEEIQLKDGFCLTANLRPVGTALGLQAGVIFIARHPCEILRVSEIHEQASTGHITIQTAGLSTVILDVTTTVDTVVTKEKGDLAQRQLKEGETIKLIESSGIGSTNNIHVTIYLKYLGKGDYR